MEKIYSELDPSLLLHIVVRKSDFKEGRQDIIDPNEYLQCALLQLNKGTTFKPHKHISKDVGFVFPQESWHVVSGRVKAIFYDINDQIITEPILEEGDTSFSLSGGHNYEILEDGTKVIEAKVGPYLGQKEDKVFI